MTIRFALIATTVFLTASSVRAEVCPDNVPEDSVQRRAQAKKWFSNGEVASKQGDDVAALKAYQCSLKFVPHGFTAYNIAQVAERVGDLELAIASYNQYLLLVPEATDAQEVNERVESLKTRLAIAREKEKARARASAAEESRRNAMAERARTQAQESKPAKSVDVETPSGSDYRLAAWIVYGGSGAVLVTGVILNILARNKMDTCNSKYNTAGGQSAAESACSSAKSLAYTSYALFGVGAAAAVVGTVLVLHPTESSDVALNVLPEGGLSLGWGGRF
jgi:tetratricopeptide (TPR) repeat protein